MKYVLVVAVKPQSDVGYGKQAPWTHFLEQVEEFLGSSQYMSRLSEGTILLRTDETLAPLSLLIDLALRQGIETRALFFEEEPQWVVTKN